MKYPVIAQDTSHVVLGPYCIQVSIQTVLRGAFLTTLESMAFSSINKSPSLIYFYSQNLPLLDIFHLFPCIFLNTHALEGKSTKTGISSISTYS